jgi:tRNA G18 (ribose-2'-O)-methylase SpoU
MRADGPDSINVGMAAAIALYERRNRITARA